MRLEYDLNVGALYIALTDRPVASTREAGDNANVDMDADGDVIGIEVISAAHPWPLAEILDTCKISDEDKAQLVAYFMGRVGTHAAQEKLPVLEAEPTAPSNVALVAA